ncbi:MAG TPA: MFS transporter [Bacteroidetes bacterium]|nr:MFS transporter [Bacteroidota bacterium]
MIYPLLPVYFTRLVPAAAAAVYVGLMDGLAESVSSLLKVYSGRWSDRLGKRKPLALAGYGLSTIARPLTAVATAGWHVVAFRFIDRIGKGVRTSPRDALISDSAPADVRGTAFSFHRMMDHAGAVLGPLVAAVFLYALLGNTLLWRRGDATPGPGEMHALRLLFALALLPGIAGVLVFWRKVREVPVERVKDEADGRNEDAGDAASPLPAKFYLFLGAVTLFTLGNSSDLFLIFYAQSRFGLGLGYVSALWISLHLSKILFSLPGGRMSDRYGRRAAILSGWAVYFLVYLAMPFTSSLRAVWGLLVLYGAYYGLTEGAERALVADYVPSSHRGRAYGIYHGAVGFSALPASLLFGVFWAELGAKTAFLIGASLAAAATLLLAGLVIADRGKRNG